MPRAYFYLANVGKYHLYVCGALVGGYTEADRKFLEFHLDTVNGKYPIREFANKKEFYDYVLEDMGFLCVSPNIKQVKEFLRITEDRL
jgi:hypothetical protein